MAGNKGLLVGLGILGLGGLALALTSKARPEGGKLVLKIYDQDGNQVAGRISGRVKAFPAGLIAGNTYTAQAIVTNASKYPDGTLVPYTFTVGFVAGVNNPVGSYFPPGAVSKLLSLGAGESGTVSFVFTIPYGLSGPGSAAAILETPEGAALYSASANFTVAPATITPGGTLNF